MEEKTVNTDVCGIYCGRLAFNLKKGKPIHFHLTSNIQETQHSRNQLSCVCYFTRDLPGLVTLSHNNPNNKISYWVSPNFPVKTVTEEVQNSCRTAPRCVCQGPAETTRADALLFSLSHDMGQKNPRLCQTRAATYWLYGLRAALLCLACVAKSLFPEPRGRRGAVQVSSYCGIRMQVSEISKHRCRNVPVSLFLGIT